ncbi:MAG: MaoC family dehydratase [Candidatus Nanopelagicales bacterium]
MTVFRTVDEVLESVGRDLGASDWMTIDQRMIDGFASVTGDHEWLHVDRARAATGPFSGTIAHGFLTLSLIPMLRDQVFRIDTDRASLNYGLNRVRFPAPVPVDSRVRVRARIIEVNEIPAGVQVVTEYTIEMEGSERPACVAEMLVLLVAIE